MCKQQIKDTMTADIYSGGLRYDSQTHPGLIALKWLDVTKENREGLS